MEKSTTKKIGIIAGVIMVSIAMLFILFIFLKSNPEAMTNINSHEQEEINLDSSNAIISPDRNRTGRVLQYRTADSDVYTLPNGNLGFDLGLGIINAEEDGEFKPIDQVRSLKGSGMNCLVIKENITDVDVECLDWNMTSFTIDIKSEAPVKIYREGKILQKEYEKTSGVQTYNLKEGEFIGVGENTTQIILAAGATDLDGWMGHLAEIFPIRVFDTAVINIGSQTLSQRRGAVEFNTSSISNTFDIINVTANLSVSSSGLAQGTNISRFAGSQMTDNSSSGFPNNDSGNSKLLNAIRLGADGQGNYLTDLTEFQTVGSHAIDLGPTAIEDLQDQLFDDYFGFGLMTGEVNGLVQAVIVSSRGSPSNQRPRLFVEVNATSCTPPSQGGWEINYSDNCVINEETLILGNINITQKGLGGSFTINHTLNQNVSDAGSNGFFYCENCTWNVTLPFGEWNIFKWVLPYFSKEIMEAEI